MFGNLDFEVEVSEEGPEGPFVPLADEYFEMRCNRGSSADIALVLDNSGSTEGHLLPLQISARKLVEHNASRGGMNGMVRVSTVAEVVSPRTASLDSLSSEIDELFISNGWTALYDGIRMGNEVIAPVDAELVDTSFESCMETPQRAIVAFTDGRENNSSGQKLVSDKYPGDGIDTSVEDLEKLRIQGVRTPLYSVGLGDNVDHDELSSLADSAGGRHFRIGLPDQIEEVFDHLAEYGDKSMRFCADMPSHHCGTRYVRVSYRWSDGESEAVGEKIERIYTECPEDREGRIVTILMAMSELETTKENVQKLATQAVRWVAPKVAPKVLVVRDDYHNRENPEDTEFVADLLQGAGFVVEHKEEPKNGLSASDLEGYDVIWFSNPGYPLDDEASKSALLAFAKSGGGVILQGDDISWSYAKNVSMSPLTRLNYIDNGTKYCGKRINNGKGAYEVTMAEDTHPIIAGIEGLKADYKNDIDTTVARGEGEQVLAWATAKGASDCAAKPVMVAYKP